MPMHRPLPSGAPRWPVLLALATLVLGAHLWLIAGGLPRWAFGSGDRTSGPGVTADPAAPSADQPSPTAAAPARVLPVEVSTVRWILPSAQPVQPTVVPAQPTPIARSEPAPPPAAEAPAETATTRPPEPLPEPAAPVAGESPVEPVPQDVQPVASADPAAPAPVVEVMDSEPPPAPAPTDELVAMASGTKAPSGAGATAAAAIPADPAPSTTLRYDLRAKAKGLSYSADAELRWQNQGSRYSARMEVSAFLLGSRIQTSEGLLGAGGLMPERFGDKGRSAEKAAHFDPAGQRIRFSSNAPDAPWQPGAQDRLSVFLQLGAMLQARPGAYPPGTTIDLQVASTGGAEIWRFEVGKTETLTLPGGSFGAVRLLRQPRREHDSTVEVWLAPAHRHLPVRIRVSEADGSQADQQLREPPPPPAAP